MSYRKGPSATLLQCANVFADTDFSEEAINVDFYLKVLYFKELSTN